MDEDTYIAPPSVPPLALPGAPPIAPLPSAPLPSTPLPSAMSPSPTSPSATSPSATSPSATSPSATSPSATSSALPMDAALKHYRAHPRNPLRPFMRDVGLPGLLEVAGREGKEQAARACSQRSEAIDAILASRLDPSSAVAMLLSELDEEAERDRLRRIMLTEKIPGCGSPVMAPPGSIIVSLYDNLTDDQVVTSGAPPDVGLVEIENIHQHHEPSSPSRVMASTEIARQGVSEDNEPSGITPGLVGGTEVQIETEQKLADQRGPEVEIHVALTPSQEMQKAVGKQTEFQSQRGSHSEPTSQLEAGNAEERESYLEPQIEMESDATLEPQLKPEPSTQQVQCLESTAALGGRLHQRKEQATEQGPVPLSEESKEELDLEAEAPLQLKPLLEEGLESVSRVELDTNLSQKTERKSELDPELQQEVLPEYKPPATELDQQVEKQPRESSTASEQLLPVDEEPGPGEKHYSGDGVEQQPGHMRGSELSTAMIENLKPEMVSGLKFKSQEWNLEPKFHKALVEHQGPSEETTFGSQLSSRDPNRLRLSALNLTGYRKSPEQQHDSNANRQKIQAFNVAKSNHHGPFEVDPEHIQPDSGPTPMPDDQISDDNGYVSEDPSERDQLDDVVKSLNFTPSAPKFSKWYLSTQTDQQPVLESGIILGPSAMKMGPIPEDVLECEAVCLTQNDGLAMVRRPVFQKPLLHASSNDRSRPGFVESVCSTPDGGLATDDKPHFDETSCSTPDGGLVVANEPLPVKTDCLATNSRTDAVVGQVSCEGPRFQRTDRLVEDGDTGFDEEVYSKSRRALVAAPEPSCRVVVCSAHHNQSGNCSVSLPERLLSAKKGEKCELIGQNITDDAGSVHDDQVDGSLSSGGKAVTVGMDEEFGYSPARTIEHSADETGRPTADVHVGAVSASNDRMDDIELCQDDQADAVFRTGEGTDDNMYPSDHEIVASNDTRQLQEIQAEAQDGRVDSMVDSGPREQKRVEQGQNDWAGVLSAIKPNGEGGSGLPESNNSPKVREIRTQAQDDQGQPSVNSGPKEQKNDDQGQNSKVRGAVLLDIKLNEEEGGRPDEVDPVELFPCGSPTSEDQGSGDAHDTQSTREADRPKVVPLPDIEVRKKKGRPRKPRGPPRILKNLDWSPVENTGTAIENGLRRSKRPRHTPVKYWMPGNTILYQASNGKFQVAEVVKGALSPSTPPINRGNDRTEIVRKRPGARIKESKHTTRD